MPDQQLVRSQGIYHGLPVYPQDLRGLTAIITGANGISGHYMLRVLSRDPTRWRRIICLSRRPPLIPGGLPQTAEHIPIDFLQGPEAIAKRLQEHNPPPKHGQGLWSDAEEMVRVNLALIKNFLDSLRLAQITPKRFMLQTGAKNYGGHLGVTKVPQEETDPRVELEPNFYYNQEDALFGYCKATSCGWNIAMPGPILGAVPDAAMNVAFPLAVYACVCKRLGKPLQFPGDVNAWQVPYSMSSAMMNAYLEEWSVLSGPANQKYNAVDNSAFAWEAFWPRLAGWYDIEARGPQDGLEYTDSIARFNPRGYGPKGVARRTFRMVDWAKKEETAKAWKGLADEYNLVQRDLQDIDRVFGFLDGSLVRNSPLHMSMDKSRKLGWHGFVDSCESYLEVFDDLAKLKMIPPVPRVRVIFN